MEKERTLLEGLLYYTAVTLRYKKLIVIVTVTAAVAVIAFSIVSLKLSPDKSPLPNTYRAYSILILQGENSGGAGSMSSMLSAFGIEGGTGGMNATQIALQVLQSRTFLDEIVDNFGIIKKFDIKKNIKTNSRNYILESSEYIYDRNSGTLTISFTSTDPQFSADVVNREVDLLEEWFINEGGSMQSKQLSTMEKKLGEISLEISKIEAKIKEFQQAYGVLNITEIAQAQSTMLGDLRSQLSQVEMEIRTYSEYSKIEDSALVNLKNRKNILINQIHRIENGYTGSDGRKMPSQKELPELSLKFARLQMNLQLQNQLFQTLSQRYEVTKLAAADSMFRVLEYADVPDVKEGPSRGKLCIMVTLGAFFGSIVLALILNMISGIQKDPDKAEILKGKKP